MSPILSNTFPVVGNGLGGLPDAIECVVSHEINGIYELQMRYPVTGQHFEEIEIGRFIMAKPDDLTDAQPFRVYRITKPLNNVVTVYARHICYDMQGIVVEPFSAGSLTEAFQTIPTVLTPANSFNFQTTRSVASGIEITEPRPLWKLLGGQEGSLLDVYGGEWDFDGYDVKLVTQLGTNRGVTIRYGKNMTDLEQDATIEAAYSGVYPFWYDEETETLVTLTEKFVTVPGAVVTNRVLTLDCSDDFDTQPTEQQLRDRANAYISANSIGNAKTSWKVSFVSSTGYEDDLRLLEQVQLGDTLCVHYDRMGVDATARAVKTEYDVLAGRYKAVTIGRVKQSLAQIIVEQQERTESQFAGVKSDIEHAVDGATDFIKHGEGYMRFIYNASDELTEIVSLDDPDITQAQSVWRWNNGGFGHSSTGYNGPYTLAITQNGAIVADFITAGTLNANVIRAGILQDAAGKNSWNMQTGAFEITDGRINVTTTNGAYDIIKLRYNGFTYNMETLMSSTEFSSRNLTTNRDTTIAGGFFFQRDLGTGQTITNIYDGVIDLYSSGGTLRQRMNNDGKLWQYDANGKKRTYLEYGDILLYTASETQTLKLSGAAFPALGGSVQLYDTSANERTRLTAEGLKFYNSSGTQTASYPATGPMTWTSSPSISASSFSLENCTGTIANVQVQFRVDSYNRIASISGRIRINNFSRTGDGPGVKLTAFNFGSRSDQPSISCGIVCNQSGIIPSECVYLQLDYYGNLFIRTTESVVNFSGTAMTMIIPQTFIKY
ncbi:MAG: phage tail protein [Oscillospiraceae bacterium]|nr:phage tail protein [Oscillospiraceae bacterium]